MNHHQRRLERIQRELERRTRTRDGRPAVRVIEVYCDGELVEVIPLHSANAELSQAIPSSSASK